MWLFLFQTKGVRKIFNISSKLDKIIKKYILGDIKAGTRNSVNRKKWLKRTLLNVPDGCRILDAGAGEQQYKKFCNHLNYVSQDFARYDGIGDGRGFHTGTWEQTELDIIGDITNILEKNASFDAIMCNEVMEHLPEPLKALKEFERLLKPGGHLIVTAPFCSATHFAPYHFYSGFNIYFFKKHLPEYSFEILEIESNGNFFEFLAQEIRRIPFMAKKYSFDRPNFFEKQALSFILKMLNRFSLVDNSSNEFLCFGYHILARKTEI